MHVLQGPHSVKSQSGEHGISSLQVPTSRSSGQLAPPAAGLVVIDLKRMRIPPPHISEQTDQLLQELTTHPCSGVGLGVGAVVGAKVGAGVGHAAVAHTRSAVAGQDRPPWAACVSIVAVRDWVPPPHVTEHVVHSFQVNEQSTGHGAVLQLRISLSGGHGWPPGLCLRTTPRNLICTPPEHFSEHTDQGVKSDTWQSRYSANEGVGAGVGAWVGQSMGLHWRSSSRGQSAPPCAPSCVMRGLRVCTPPPHDTVQGLQPYHVWAQCTGHACVLQLLSCLLGGHSFPPFTAS